MRTEVTLNLYEAAPVRTVAYRRPMDLLGEPYTGEGYGIYIDNDVLMWLPQEHAAREVMLDRLIDGLKSLYAPATDDDLGDKGSYRYHSARELDALPEGSDWAPERKADDVD
jgi:hypothetical protein